MTVAFYISGHGFGHASRDVEVINALTAARPGLRVIIRSAVAPGLLARTVRGSYDLLAGECDSGVIQRSSVAHDDEATVTAAAAFYGTFDERIETETRTLAPVAPMLIVGDIPPLAFEVGARLGVPAIALANFTWDWIFETHPGFLPEHAGLIERMRRAYGLATDAFQLPFAAGFDVFPRVTPIPLVARRPTQDRSATRAHFGLPPERRVVLLSFGGYGMPSLDLATVDCRGDWTIATTDLSSPDARTAGHVVVIGSEALAGGTFRYEDLVAASDAVLTKPGYGIIAECIAADTPMLYTSRGHFREYDMLVSALPRVLRSRFISQEDLFAGRWQASLDSLLAQPAAPERIDVNGAEVAAGVLGNYL